MRRFRTMAAAAAVAALAACADEDPTGTEVAPEIESAASPGNGFGPTPKSISLTRIGGFVHPGGETAAEIPAYDEVTQRLFVVNAVNNRVDVLDLSDPANPSLITSIDPVFGTTPNSVDTFEGTSIDPEGSISIIDVTDITQPAVRTAGFGGFSANFMRHIGVRIFGPGATVAQDLEPEYVTVSEDGRTAYASLQEANALAIIDVNSATVTRIVPLGYKYHGIPRNALDPSDEDGGPHIGRWPVFGMYQPDAIGAFTVLGRTFIISANEGDARDYDGFAEEERVEDLDLDPRVFRDRVCGGPCTDEERLGRLTVTSTLGQFGGGDYEALFAFGGRSFSIWNAQGFQVFDSGDDLERRTLDLVPHLFNASNEDPPEVDNRSDNKGPEPEGLALGRFGRKVFAFIGLERIGGVIVYDVSNPHNAKFVDYVNTRETNGDLGPEGLVFVPANESPNGEPLLIVGNEISGTTTILQILLN